MAERAIQTEPAARYGHKDVRSVAKNPGQESHDANAREKFDAWPCPATSDRLTQPDARDLLPPFPTALTTKIRSSQEVPAIQRLLAFRQRASARDLTAGVRCGSNSRREPRGRALRKPA